MSTEAGVSRPGGLRARAGQLAHGLARLHPLIPVGIVALIVRLVAIQTRPLWYDEAFAVLFAGKGPGAMLYGTLASQAGTAADVHPLAYYTLLWMWMGALGQSPLAVRALSVILGLGILFLAWVLASRLVGRRLAIVAAVLVALSPFQVHYAQETRMYAMLAFTLLAATLALREGLQGSRRAWWVVFAILAALSQYTHHLAVFYLVPLALTPLWKRNWRGLRHVALAGLGSLLLYLPWLLQLPSQFARVQQAYWTTRPSPARLITTLLSFVTNLPLPDLWLPVALFISLLCTALAGWQTWRSWRSGSELAHAGLWLAYLAFSPVLLLYLFSQWQPVYIERALLPSGVVFLVWVGWGLWGTGLPRPVSLLASAGLLLGMVIGLVQHVNYQGFPYAPYATLGSTLETEIEPGDVIVHSNKLSMLPLVYYSPDLPARYLPDPPGSGSDTLAPATQQVLNLPAEENLEGAVSEASRVWFVIFERAIDEYRRQGLETHPHLAWLESQFQRREVNAWGDLSLYLYGK